MKNRIMNAVCCMTALACMPVNSVHAMAKGTLVTPENVIETMSYWTGGYENEDIVCRWNDYTIVVLNHEHQPVMQPCYMITRAFRDETGYGMYEMVNVNPFNTYDNNQYIYSDYAYCLSYNSTKMDTAYAALDGNAFKVGDLVTIEGDYGIPEPNYEVGAHHQSTSLLLYEGAKVVLLGKAMDCFGQEFEKCVHNLMGGSISAYDCYDISGVIINQGDTDDSGSLDIMDVIAVNKYNLGASDLNFYCTIAADVDHSHKVDSTDSLMILKEVVGLTKGFAEQ